MSLLPMIAKWCSFFSFGSNRNQNEELAGTGYGIDSNGEVVREKPTRRSKSESNEKISRYHDGFDTGIPSTIQQPSPPKIKKSSSAPLASTGTLPGSISSEANPEGGLARDRKYKPSSRARPQNESIQSEPVRKIPTRSRSDSIGFNSIPPIIQQPRPLTPTKQHSKKTSRPRNFSKF
jgi:hypothetical protein